VFDVVSMQFCLHYSFETQAKARTMLENVTSNLRSGGWFIGTIPDAYWIVKKIKALLAEEKRLNKKMEKLEFGNDVYSIRLARDEVERGFRKFGCKYWFHLKDAVDCPEYLVHWPSLVR
jgi:mRNA (guanine-N7-)-methyltransferase